MHILAERLEEEPLLLFQLRGMPIARVLERIHEKRTLSTRGENQAHPVPPAASDQALVTPIENLLHDFWRPGRRLHDLETRAIATHTPHALLRRLGASPLGGDSHSSDSLQQFMTPLGHGELRFETANQPNHQILKAASEWFAMSTSGRKVRFATTIAN